MGVGASAGGFEALRRLLEAVPDDPPFALVIVHHLARDRPSLVPELLAKYTRMPVKQVDDGPMVKPGHVYVIPPGQFLSINSGRLSLTQMTGPRRTPVTIDFFFAPWQKISSSVPSGSSCPERAVMGLWGSRRSRRRAVSCWHKS